MNIHNNGLGGTLGDVLATNKPIQVSGAVWYVNATGGVDAGGTAGQDREKPLATLGQAVTNASNGDIIDLLDGHTETLTAALAIGKTVLIVGEGSAGGLPTVQLKINAAAASLLSLTTAVVLRNIRFPASVQSNIGPGANAGKVRITGNQCQIIGCYFEQSGLDQLPALSIGTAVTAPRIENSTFISTATAVATRPTYGLFHEGTVSDFDVVGTVFSDGTVGFSGAAWDGSFGIATRLRGINVSQLLGATIVQNASSIGFLNVQTSTGGGSIRW
jgi:hypothetical protein